MPSGAVVLEERSDEELVTLVQGGDSDVALEILYRRYYPKVHSFAWRFTGNAEDAADLTQEVFLRLQTRLASFRAESRFSTWLYTVTRSVAINRGVASRRRHTEPLLFEPEDEPATPAPPIEERMDQDRSLARLRASMERELDPEERRVVWMHLVEGMTLPAIGRALGLENRSGAKAPFVRAVRKLRRALPEAFRDSAPGQDSAPGERTTS